MIKLSNEVKVGAVTLITIVVFVWVFNFLKGKDYFRRTANYYAVYDEIGGLAESSPVEINGYQVGVVQSIDFITPESGRLLVKFSVSKDFRLPKNTFAEVLPVSIIAGMKVRFVFGKGPGFYSDGDTIPGRLAESIVTKLETELVPIKERIMTLLNTLDSVIGSVNEIMDPSFKKNLSGTIAHLNGTTQSIDNIFGSKEKELKTTLDNITRFSQMLSDNSGKMNSTFKNLESISDTLAAADIYKTISGLKISLEKTSLLVGNLNEGKGSAGQLLTNDSIYSNLNNSLESLNELLKDMKANPKRYVHFSIFNKKNIPEK
jgi:phospholipid/cholesterol/gamma-HCH transport system substrate-binding protein